MPVLHRFWSSLAFATLMIAIDCGAVGAQTDMKNKEFAQLYRKNRKEAVKYISVIHNGFSWFQAVGEKTYERKPLYCPPAQLAITDDQVVKIYRDYLKKNPNDESYAALSLIEAFIFTFPCSN